MSPQHHPSDDWLLAYAAGTLDEAQGVVIAAHAEKCPRCRALIARANAVGGALLSALPPTPVTEETFKRLERHLEVDGKAQPFPSIKPPDGDLPAALTAFIPNGLQALRWKRLAAGARAVRLPVAVRGTSRLWLLEAQPGAPFPAHAHRGNEINLVLRGSYKGNGIYYGPGDAEDSVDGSHHTIDVSPDEGCLCLVYTEGRIKPDGLMAKIILRFTGF